MIESTVTAIESMPQLTPLEAIERRNSIVRFVKAAMKEGTDYGIIPGTEKKTLYKPGAEKLCTLFGLSWRLVPVDQIMDWTGKEHDGEPFFWFSYRCVLRHGGVYVGESEGSCSSWEKKYRYRDAKRKCPECHREAIFKSKPRQNDPPEKKQGWYCYGKVGGCGAQFQADDKRITEQAVGQIKNPDIHDLVNTIQKMAEKRAFVGSTVLAVNASEFFSGDMDEIDYTESELEERAAAAAAKKAETPEEVRTRMQAASKSLRGDQGDLGPELKDSYTADQAGNGNKPAPESPKSTEWPTSLLNQLVMHYKGGNIHEYRARITKSAILKPDDKFAIITHWMDIYNTERVADIAPDEAARRADADRQATKESA